MTGDSLITFVISSMVILVVIGISVLWFFYFLQNKNIKLQLKEKENKLLYQKELLTNTVKTQEAERTRISGELHDDVASRLNVMHLNLHLLKRKMHDDPAIHKIIDQIESSLGESIDRTRTISHELMPQILKKFGFHHALHELIQSLNGTGTIRVEFNDDFSPSLRDNMEELHLFRIIQELINNTLKYAQATQIQILFEKTDHKNETVLHYKDNGKGFDPESVKLGLGLYNINTRAELLKGVGTYLPTDTGIHFTLKFTTDA